MLKIFTNTPKYLAAKKWPSSWKNIKNDKASIVTPKCTPQYQKLATKSTKTNIKLLKFYPYKKLRKYNKKYTISYNSKGNFIKIWVE